MNSNGHGYWPAGGCPNPRDPRADDGLNNALLDRLRSLSFASFERCVCRLLVAMGYEAAAVLGRVHFKGRNRQGGADIQAFGRLGVSSTKLVVQCKQYDRPVQAKYVDELRGAMLRLGAGQGMVVATAAFSPVAVASARTATVAPVKLIDGEALVRLMRRYRVRVRPGLAVVMRIDEAFFAGLADTGKSAHISKKS